MHEPVLQRGRWPLLVAMACGVSGCATHSATWVLVVASAISLAMLLPNLFARPDK